MKLIKWLFNKEYNDLQSKEIEKFVDEFCEKLPYFKGDFPNFMPHIVIALEKHPSISQSSRDRLLTYSDMFDLNWKEDVNKHLFESPVWMKDTKPIADTLDFNTHFTKLKAASKSYVEDLRKYFQ